MKPHTFRIPIFLALLTAAGLASALVGDGVSDAMSWLALGLPALAATYFSLRSSA